MCTANDTFVLRMTQVSPGATVPFSLFPGIHEIVFPPSPSPRDSKDFTFSYHPLRSFTFIRKRAGGALHDVVHLTRLLDFLILRRPCIPAPFPFEIYWWRSEGNLETFGRGLEQYDASVMLQRELGWHFKHFLFSLVVCRKATYD